MIPRKQAFSNTKGFQAQADVGINSPSQSNNQSVNVVISPLTKDRGFEVITDKSHYEHKEIPLPNDTKTRFPEGSLRSKTVKLESEHPLNDDLENDSLREVSSGKALIDRSIDTAKKSLTEMETLLKDKDNLIEALSLLLDIYENNPFIVNKFIVAQEEELTRLLFLLTGAEEIQLIKSDPEVKCCVKKIDKVQYISKIMVKKGGNTYNFKYSFPNVVQLLDNRKVTWKLVC